MDVGFIFKERGDWECVEQEDGTNLDLCTVATYSERDPLD